MVFVSPTYPNGGGAFAASSVRVCALLAKYVTYDLVTYTGRQRETDSLSLSVDMMIPSWVSRSLVWRQRDDANNVDSDAAAALVDAGLVRVGRGRGRRFQGGEVVVAKAPETR